MTAEPDRRDGSREVVLDVTGMTCAGCETHVVEALRAVPGVDRAGASHPRGEAVIRCAGNVPDSALEDAVRRAGYEGTVRHDDPDVPSIGSAAGNGRTGSADDSIDLIVLGGGSAGFAAALKAAENGARVAMVNAGALGGTCVNVGCVPSKTLLRAAEAVHRRQHHGFAGIATDRGPVDWKAVRTDKDALVEELREDKYWKVLKAQPNVTLFEQRGTVASDGSVGLEDGTRLTAGATIITTGSSPWAAPIPGLGDGEYLDSTTAMELQRLPESLVVIGAGFVGVEQGQIFARLGVRVTVISRRDTILPREDPAIGRALAGYLAEEGIEVVTGAHVERVTYGDGEAGVHYRTDAGGGTVQAERVLVATGRRANTAGFGLPEAGVGLGERGEILVDDHFQTTNPRIYAAGDVTGEPMFVYVAAYAGAMAAENALRGNALVRDLDTVPRVTFSDPAVAAVGLTETVAAERGYDARTSVLPLDYVPRALAARDTRGFVKLVADGNSRKMLGAHILAAEAGEMITEVTLAVRFGLTIDDLTSTFHPYLTLSEGIKLAAQTFDKDVATLSCCAA